MRFSFVAIASTIAATAVLAAPTPRHPTKNDTASDLEILNYALGLEHLESAFYAWGLAKHDAAAFEHAGLHNTIRERFVRIGEHESAHVNILTSTIKSLHGTPVPKCTYKFPQYDVPTFVAIARALEQTGVSAYLGVAAKLRGDLLTASESIATVEARQSSFLNEVFGQSGIPYTFDTPLTQKEVLTLASSFIESCPYKLRIVPFKQLTAKLPEKGNKVMVKYEGEDPHAKTWCQFLYNNKVVVSPRNVCALPPTVTGYVYVVVTKTATPISLHDDSAIIAGPALLFKGDH